MTQFKSKRDQELEKFLQRLHGKSKAYQEKKGRRFEITWDQYLIMWKRKPRFYHDLRSRVFMDPVNFIRSDQGYVLSWIDKDAFMGGICTIHTMEIKTRKMSKRVCHMRNGDTHSKESKDKIRDARIGKKHSRDTKEAISASLSGAPKSAEAKKNMSEAASRRWAKVREDKAAAMAAMLGGHPRLQNVVISCS